MKYKKATKADIGKFMGIADRTVYKWREESRPAVMFVDKYLRQKDLVEFNTTGECTLFEEIDSYRKGISYYELNSIYSFIRNVNNFPQEEKVNREGFLLKVHYCLDSFNGDNENFVEFCSMLSMEPLTKAKNAELGANFYDIKHLFEYYVSNMDRKTIIDKKSFILPILKSMRKYN